MKNENTSFSIVKAIKTVYNSIKKDEKAQKPKYEPSWMYRNE